MGECCCIRPQMPFILAMTATTALVSQGRLTLDLEHYAALGKPPIVQLTLTGHDLMVTAGGIRRKTGHYVRIIRPYAPIVRFNNNAHASLDKLRFGRFPAVIEKQSGLLLCRILGCAAHPISGYERI